MKETSRHRYVTPRTRLSASVEDFRQALERLAKDTRRRF